MNAPIINRAICTLYGRKYETPSAEEILKNQHEFWKTSNLHFIIPCIPGKFLKILNKILNFDGNFFKFFEFFRILHKVWNFDLYGLNELYKNLN